jgi:hypothetical protein
MRLIAPDGLVVPGVFMCREHAEECIEEYAEKLGERWTLLDVRTDERITVNDLPKPGGGEYTANAQLTSAAPDLLAACKESLVALEREHRERQERLDQAQDEWSHRHADDINVPNDAAIWGGIEVEEPPVMAFLRAAIAKAEGR